MSIPNQGKAEEEKEKILWNQLTDENNHLFKADLFISKNVKIYNIK